MTKTIFSRPWGIVTGVAPVHRASLRFLNKVQELVPGFLIRLRDDVYPLWKTFMNGNRDQRGAMVERMASTLAVRMDRWATEFRISHYLSYEATWQFQRWDESEQPSLRFEREFEISDTLFNGLYPFAWTATHEFDEEALPERVERISQEHYPHGRDYAAAVSHALGEKGIWKLSPDHADLDRRCEMLVRYQVLNQSETEIVAQMNLASPIHEVRNSIKQLGGMIGQELRPVPELRLVRDY